ncbi:hypothetical protein GCM10010495_69530 [Kitasatospora herbaricolor]|nr:hypothetical protein GCM10010495_69530 [Kitasatospora herbaricolor]
MTALHTPCRAAVAASYQQAQVPDPGDGSARQASVGKQRGELDRDWDRSRPPARGPGSRGRSPPAGPSGRTYRAPTGRSCAPDGGPLGRRLAICARQVGAGSPA